MGSGTVSLPSERALVSSFIGTPYSNFTSMFTRFIVIATFVRHFFPTPPLVSPKFPHVNLGLGESPFGYKERRCWANSLCN